MTKRYREPVDVEEAGHGVPVTFHWRGGTYRVGAVLGHWREDAGWWAGAGMAVPQRDLWRVEARGAPAVPRADFAGPGRADFAGPGRAHELDRAVHQPGRGVYELVREGGRWRLDRVWD